MGKLTEGLTNNSPQRYDSSMKPPAGRVDDGAVRKGIAPTPKTLGPRKDGM